MRQERATQRRWTVQRTFEPDRLSPATLVQAYGQIVPPSIRVLPRPIAAPEAEGRPDDQNQDQLNSPGTPKLTELAAHKPPPKQSLVIEPITKKEAI